MSLGTFVTKNVFHSSQAHLLTLEKTEGLSDFNIETWSVSALKNKSGDFELSMCFITSSRIDAIRIVNYLRRNQFDTRYNTQIGENRESKLKDRVYTPDELSNKSETKLTFNRTEILWNDVSSFYEAFLFLADYINFYDDDTKRTVRNFTSYGPRDYS